MAENIPNPNEVRLLNNALPYPLPRNSVLALVQNDCTHCQHLLKRTGYPTKTDDGRPIIYVDLSGPAGEFKQNGFAYLDKLGVSTNAQGTFLHGTRIGGGGTPAMLGVDGSGKISGMIGLGADAIINAALSNTAARVSALGATENLKDQCPTGGKPYSLRELTLGQGPGQTPICSLPKRNSPVIPF